MTSRPPVFTWWIEAATKMICDSEEVMKMVVERPQAILDNVAPELVAKPKSGWLSRFMGR